MSKITARTVLIGIGHSASAATKVFRGYVKEIGGMTSRCVSNNRAQSPQQMLDATGRKQYEGYRSGGPWGSPDPNVVNAMPKGQGVKAEVFFFSLGRTVNDTELARAYGYYNLSPADPYSLCAAIESTDEHWYATHWRGANGSWCSLQLNSYGIVIGLHSYAWTARFKKDIECNGGDYGEQEIFAGLRI